MKIFWRFLLLPSLIALSCDTNADEFSKDIRPLLTKYCTECHSEAVAEAEINFDLFENVDDVRRDASAWIKTRHMLDSGQMPPKDALQPSDEEREQLQKWVHEFLKREAQATAGDPGPVVLRRLNNEEYNYTIRDLTGVASLDPTQEFPVDGAAGEGFINTGAAQAMSPSMVSKYLEAAKEVASHAVLQPDGITFSAGQSRREWTDERLKAVQLFYDRYTVPTQVFVEVGGTGKVANDGGTIPYQDYLTATIEQRDELMAGQTTIDEVASAQQLNGNYLRILWNALTDKTDSVLLNDFRKRWLTSQVQDVPRLIDDISAFQLQLWTFNSIGQLTEGGKQKQWMSPVNPVVTRQEIRLPLEASNKVYLSVNDLGDGNAHDDVVWNRPRLEFKPDATGEAHPPILLRDVSTLQERITGVIQTEGVRTAQYLQALAKAQQSKSQLQDIAKEFDLNATLLANWSRLAELGVTSPREITGHFTTKVERVAGYDVLNGWGSPQTPSMMTNRGTEAIDVSTLTVPARSVVVHPSPTKESVVAWRCPINGEVKLSGRVADADNKCGNGAAWRVELLSETGKSVLGEGVFDNGRESSFQPDQTFEVREGDIVSLFINARDQSHVCDTTHIELTLTEVGNQQRRWDLPSDVVDSILESNPRPDSYGHAEVWHFCAVDSQPDQKDSQLIPNSTLAHWRTAVMNAESEERIAELANSVQEVVLQQNADQLSEPNRQLRAQLLDWMGPLRWTSLVSLENSISGALEFGKHPNGSPIDAASMCVHGPQTLEVTLPTELSSGAEFVVTVEMHKETGNSGSVQVLVSITKPDGDKIVPSQPVLIGDDANVRERIEQSLIEFRNLFPPAVCYSRIVPVDEVVTLTLYFREDDHLQRLLLNESQVAELERLWDELLYVAQEPVALTVAFEQIYEFATQDRPDLVKAFEPMRKPINDRADLFRERLQRTEPIHLDAAIAFADRAWRRQLSDDEQQSLRNLYQQLRKSGLAHEESIRLTLARILAAPAFLYRREQPVAGSDSAPVTDAELATRLSYFLWSSLPDAQLRDVADAGRLTNEEALLEQTQRMLSDPRTRRLAVQFACQWLHLRDFDQNDDKNEQLYPEFAELRDDIYEETVRFFEDMFRNNGSILDVVAADHTFLNGELAQHYGLKVDTESDWQRVKGVRQSGRGGILGMASFQASQAGASRTSPILRGNWIYETLLGERLPRPPANVPQLPEQVPSGLTARQLIEQHSSDEACAKCHKKIDPYGFALEQYDAIGRVRSSSVDTRTQLEDGTAIDGLDGLRDYLLNQRRDDFVRQFCRKLLGYALGREVQLSDGPLLDEMQTQLHANGYRFHAAVETIVLSQQFQHIRGMDFEPRSAGDN